MHIPSYFKIDDIQAIRAVIRRHPFALLVTPATTRHGYSTSLAASPTHETYVEHPWSIKEAQADTERLISRVLAFVIGITRLEGNFKLSQNHLPANQEGVMRKFEKAGDSMHHEMLGLMRSLYADVGETY